jgi:peptide/nickel transport system substrate-binding protein
MTNPVPDNLKNGKADFTTVNKYLTRRQLVVGGFSIGALALAGCSSSSSKSAASSSPSAATTASGSAAGSATGSASAAASSAAAPKPTGSLTALTDTIASGFDRDGADTDPGYAEAAYNTFDPLISYPQPLTAGAFVPDFSAEATDFVPRLALSWTQPSPMVWVLKLRQGVMSAAGNEFTSADVVYTFARAKSVSGSAPNSWFISNVAGILPTTPVMPNATAADKTLTNEVVAVDKYTVQFNLVADAGRLFLIALADLNLLIFDSVEMKKNATAADPWSHTWGNKNCAGFGAYSITSFTPGTSITYEAVPNYYRGAPLYSKVETTAVAQGGNRLSALEKGSAEVATNLAPSELATLQGKSGINLLGSYTNQIVFIPLNYSYAPWNLPPNQLLRQAVAYAIPYDDIVKLDYLGFGRRMYSQVPSTFAGYKAIQTYTTDLDKAKALLTQAGFPGGKGLAQYASGLQMFYVSERSSLLEPIANRIRTNLAAIGINITLEPLPQAQFATRQLETHNLPMSIFDFSSPSIPTAGFIGKLLYQSSKSGGLVDPTNFSNAAIDKLLSASANPSTADTDTMQDMLMSLLPTIPLVEFRPTLATKAPLTGWYQVLDATVPVYSYFQD